MNLRIKEILKEKGKSKYWLYIQLGLSYQNFNKIVNNQTEGIKFKNLKAICDILEATFSKNTIRAPNKIKRPTLISVLGV